MAAHQAMSIPEALSKSKLDALQVSVNEVESDSPPHDIDRLSIQSPPPHMSQTMMQPHRPITRDPNIICALPAQDPSRLRSPSPTGSVRSSFASRRRVSRRSQWSSHHSHSRSHHSEVSKELTIQAESEFFALMELMSGITLRSTSLKEVWRKIISERESHCSEMESMYERIDEFTETIERHEKEKHSHNHDHEERKKAVLKLELDLKIAIEASAGYKKQLHDRDCELEKAHGEIAEFKDTYKYLEERHEETKTTLQETQLQLSACEERCRRAEDDCERHHGEVRSWKSKYTELESRSTETTTKFESTSKELISLKSLHAILVKERRDWLCDKEELEEEIRKHKHHEHEYQRELKEITESFEKKKHEVHEMTEKVSKMKHEREEYTKEIKSLKTQLKEAHHHCEEHEHACRKWKRKWEECDRELGSVRALYEALQITHTETSETIIKKTEEIRKLTIERDECSEQYHAKCKEYDDAHRDIIVFKESIRRLEVSIKEKLEIIHTHSERIERLERDLTETCRHRDTLKGELSLLQSTNVSLKLEFDTLTTEHACTHEKLRECETRYESVHTQLTEYHESGGDWEGECERLEESLKEARVQKDRAVEMRIEADRQRDEYVGRYEAKCREVERLSEERRRQRHGHGHGHGSKWGGSVYSRSVIGEEEESRSVVGGEL
jgi:chromosome segregation ATPase